MSAQSETETEKMRRVPGIVFADGVAGRRARVAGTGIDVFEVIGSYRSAGDDWAALREAYHWLAEDHLRAALAYYEAYPEEIEERLAREESLTPECVWAAHPFMKPKQR
jgi:uncharacterized protein (DUF433 family)